MKIDLNYKNKVKKLNKSGQKVKQKWLNLNKNNKIWILWKIK